MNRQQRINTCLRLVDLSYKCVKNAVRISKANTLDHEHAKFLKCWELLQEGREFYTEVIFKTGGRCDILVPEDFRIFEILHTETKAEALRKEDYYPEECHIVYLSSDEVLKDEN